MYKVYFDFVEKEHLIPGRPKAFLNATLSPVMKMLAFQKRRRASASQPSKDIVGSTSPLLSPRELPPVVRSIIATSIARVTVSFLIRLLLHTSRGESDFLFADDATLSGLCVVASVLESGGQRAKGAVALVGLRGLLFAVGGGDVHLGTVLLASLRTLGSGFLGLVAALFVGRRGDAVLVFAVVVVFVLVALALRGLAGGGAVFVFSRVAV